MRFPRRAWLAAAIAAAAALAYFMLFRSDEAEALATLDRIARVLSSPATAEAPTLRRTRLDRELAGLIGDDVVIQIAGMTRIRGRAELVALAADAVGPEARANIELSAPEIRVDGRNAAARGEGVLTLARRGVLERDSRSYQAIFERRDGRWVLTSLDIARATHEQPEARP